MVHRPHDRRLVLQDLLRPLRQLLLGDDLERRPFFCKTVFDEEDDAKGSHSEQVAHTKHLSEAIQLLALGLSIFLQERLR